MLPQQIILSYSELIQSENLRANINCKPDLFINIGDKIFPIHRCKFQDSDYISKFIRKSERFHIIEEPLNVEIAQNIFSLFYGYDMNIKKMRELAEVLNIADYLSMPIIIRQIEGQIKKCLSQYDIFPLLSLAYRFNLHQLFVLCIEVLQHEQFEQINYNKFEFIQYEFILFQIVLRRHHCLKIKGKILGLSPDAIEEVIKLYCSTHHYDQETLRRLLDKYVKSIINFGLLQLDRIMTKEIQKSGILDQSNEAFQLVREANKVKTRNRRLSCQIQLLQKNDNLSKFAGYSNQHGLKKQYNQQPELIQEEIQDKKQNECAKNNINTHKNIISMQKNQQAGHNKFNFFQSLNDVQIIRNRQVNILNKAIQISENFSSESFSEDYSEHAEDAEVLLNRISSLVEQYNCDYKVREGALDQLKKRVSMISDRDLTKQELPKTAKFNSEFRLTNTLQIKNPQCDQKCP